MSAARKKAVKAKARNIYCTPEEHAAIKQLAAQAGMSRSAYMVACALPEEDEGETGCALVLSEADQRALLESVKRLEGCLEALLAPEAETGLSLLQGLECLVAQRQRAS